MPSTLSQALVDGSVPMQAFDSTSAIQNQKPISEYAFDAMPGFMQSFGISMNRGQRTILYGGRKPNMLDSYEATSRRAQRGYNWTRAWFANNRNPFRKMTTQQLFDGQRRAGVTYTPFNIGQTLDAFSERLGNPDSRITKAFNKMGVTQENAKGFVNSGFLSRMGAAGKVGKMSDAEFARLMNMSPGQESLGTFIQNSAKPLTGARIDTRRQAQIALSTSGGRLGGFVGAADMGLTTFDDIGYASSIGGKAGATQAIGYAKNLGLKEGYTARQAFSAGRNIGDEAAEGLGRQLLNEKARKAGAKKAGAEVAEVTAEAALKAGKKAALRRGAALGVAKVGMKVASVANPIGLIALGYDLTKLSGAIAWKGANFAAEGYASMTRGMQTGPLSGNFKENEVSYTSRQRGVQAIANSRLNARSVLGNEAAMVARHFG